MVQFSFALDLEAERFVFDWANDLSASDDGSVVAALHAAGLTRFILEYIGIGELHLYDSETRILLSRVEDARSDGSGIWYFSCPARTGQARGQDQRAGPGDELPDAAAGGCILGIDLGEGFRAPIRSNHPALLIAGSLDGRTVLAEQEEVAAQFQRKTRVLVENAGHNVFEAHHDVQPLLVRFFRGEAVADTRLTLPPPKFHMA